MTDWQHNSFQNKINKKEKKSETDEQVKIINTS